MDFTVPEDVTRIRAMVRDFVEKEIMPIENEITRLGEAPAKMLAQMKELGLYGMTIPEAYGGLGRGCMAYCLVMEELGRAPKPFLYEVVGANTIGSKPLVIAGSPEQKEKYLPAIARGEKITAFALTEPNAGSDAAAIQTTAMPRGDKWVLNGTKHFISNGARADVVTVLAVTDKAKRTRGGMTAFLVEKGTPGFGVAQLQVTMAGPPVVQAELVFEDCVLSREAVLGEVGQGFSYIMQTLDFGRVQHAAAGIGVGGRLLELSLAYAKQRVQFGKPIAEQQVIQHMLADMATEIYAARCMWFLMPPGG